MHHSKKALPNPTKTRTILQDLLPGLFPDLFPDLFYVFVLGLLTIAFFWRVLSGDVYQPADGGDLVSLLFPTYRFAAAQLSQGVIPLWNPHLRFGAPFISDIQAGFLYPPNLLLFLLNPNFDYKWMQWLSIGHIFWAGLGIYVMLRSLGSSGEREKGRQGDSAFCTPHSISPVAALFGALAFQFSDAFFIHLGNLNLIAVLSWMPWVLTAFSRALRLKSLRWAAIAGLLFAIGNFAGHAQSSLYVGLAVIGYWLLEARWFQVDTWRLNVGLSFISNLKYLILTFLITLLLNAPILLPAVEMAGYTQRANFTYQQAISYSLDPVQALAGLLSPGFFGRGPALHWSFWDRVETPYVGVVALLMAIAALVFAGRKNIGQETIAKENPVRENLRALFPWIGLAIMGFLIALGVYGILHGILYWILPGFNQFRGPARAIVLWALGVSALAAFGVDALGRWGEGEKEAGSSQFATFLKRGGLFLILFVTPLIYATLLVTQGEESAFLRASLAALSVLIATLLWLATWGIVWLQQAGWLRGTTAAWLLVALLFIDFTSTGAYTDISSDDPTKGFQHPEVVDFLKADPDLFRIDTRTSPDPGVDCIWQPNTAALVGLQDVCSDPNPLTLTAWKLLWDSTGTRASQRYDMLNIKYVIVRDGTPLPGDGKFELAFDAPDEFSVYRNRDFLPRAWLSNDLASGTPDSSLPPVTMTHYAANEFSAHVSTPLATTLVLSELWYPGWQATINGIKGDVKQNEIGLRVLDVPAGESEIKLWFAPVSWTIGLGAAGIGLLLCLILVVKK